MISLGTRFPCGTHFRTWMFAMLNISMHHCIPVGYDISLKSVQADFAFMHAPAWFVFALIFVRHRSQNRCFASFCSKNMGRLKIDRDLLDLCSSGHVFNMPHDNVKACEEVFGKLKDNHMMSPTLIQIDRSRPWSVCSAAIITEFLDSGHG